MVDTNVGVLLTNLYNYVIIVNKEKEDMKTKTSKNEYWIAMFPILCLFSVIAGIALSHEINREYGQDADKLSAGMSRQDTKLLQGVLDGTETVKASTSDSLLAGAEAGGLTKAFGGKNSEAFGAAAASALIDSAIQHATAGCYATVYVDGRHRRFHTDAWVCLKYKDSHGENITVERTSWYSDLAYPGEHKTEQVCKPSYKPKF